MTIARDRWQLHLKTRGQHYHDRAREMEALAAGQPDCGARQAAMAFDALAGIMEQARVARLTRFQHILLRMGEWIAYAECAGCLARRAVRLAQGKLPEKSNRRFDAAAFAAISRIFAREAALRVALEGSRWVTGAGSDTPALDLAAFQRAQAGLMADMDLVADALYGRTAKAARAA